MMNEQYPVKKDFGRERNNSNWITNPYTIAICRPNRGATFVVKGPFQQVLSYLVGLDRPLYITYKQYLGKNNKACILFDFMGLLSRYSATLERAMNNRWQLRVLEKKISGYEVVYEKFVRRPPRKWPVEMNAFLKPQIDKEAWAAGQESFETVQALVQEVM